MSLIEEIKKLRELEQKATPGKWQWYNTHYPGGPAIIPESGEAIAELYQKTRPDEDGMFIAALRNLAPAMLSVLECFREGDAETLHLMKEILSHVKEDNIISIRLKHGQDISDYVDCLARSERAASLMEQEES